MRLIDVDRLFDNLERVRNVSNEVFREIANSPTVKAIPKGWISEYSRRPISNVDYWAIIRMVTAWEKENEESN